ncbi:MAG: M20/M25/M40 family metallo-hydrolase [Anaerovoracaceae bacterium]
MRKKIDNYIVENRTNIIKDIIDLVRIESVNGDKEGNARALRHILHRAENMGMKTMLSAKGDIGIIEIGQGKELIGILTHVDVVGVGDIEKWSYPPFEGKIAKGCIWGRGVVDDKGPAVMCLYALKAIKELEIPLNKRIWLIVGTSEESEWTDIASFKEEFEMPDCGFSPDGDFPIYNREKGYCDVELLFEEPCRNMMEKVEAGDSPNSIPSKAVFKLKEQEEMTFHGISCHSSVPGMGINAIEKMIVSQGFRTEFNFVRFISDFLSKDYNGTRLGIDDPKWAENDSLDKTIAVPTILTLTEEGVKLNINLRLWFDVTREKVESSFEKFSSEYGYTFKISDYLEPMEVSEDEEFLQLMADVYESYGLKSSFRTAAGTSYAKSMEHFVSWGPVFETEPSCAHMENERLSIESMILASQIYATYLAKMASSFGELMKRRSSMSSLEKGLYLLSLFAEPPYRYDVAELVELTGINRTTIYRNLTSLEEFGFLKRDDRTKIYTMGPMAEKMFRAGKVK